MIPAVVVSNEPSSRLYVRTDFYEEFRSLADLSNEERGLFMTLRNYSATNGGIETDDPEEFWQVAKNFAGLSRYKFKKLFSRVLSRKFENFCGRFFYAPDEERLQEAKEKLEKYRGSGKLGGIARWKNARAAEMKTDIVPIATLSNQPSEFSEYRSLPLPPPEPDAPEQAGGADSHPKPENHVPERTEQQETKQVAPLRSPETPSETPPQSPRPVPIATPDGFEKFCEHCEDLGLPRPGRKLWKNLREKFPFEKTEQILEHLKRFDNQQSPGLWDTYSAEDLMRIGRGKPSGRQQREEIDYPYLTSSMKI